MDYFSLACQDARVNINDKICAQRTFSLLSTNVSIVHNFKITSALTMSENDLVSVAKRLSLN